MLAKKAGIKIVVDLNRCQSYAQCAFLAPNVFEIHGEEALIYTPLPPTTSASVSAGPQRPARCKPS
jgi:ferredoxin